LICWKCKIDNAQYIIEGVNIKQNQNTKVAEFFGPTTITNKPILKTESILKEEPIEWKPKKLSE
jgi:hypothetical protein